jgi:predicted Zn-dependent peptidase
MPDSVQRRLLANGIPLVTEHLSHLRSMSLGVWVETGSRDEGPGEWGISHFLEHTFFKGTDTRSAEAIAQEADALGADLNAFTGREQTAFYIKVLSDGADEAAALLADVLTRPAFDEDQLARERHVVGEEIRMVEDDPEEWVHELHAAHVWGPDAPLGRAILGTPESVAGLTRERIHAYLARRYTPDRMVVAAAGHFDPEALFARMDATLGRLPVGSPDPADPMAATTGAPEPAFAGLPPVLHFRDLEQAHLCVSGRGLPAGHPDRFGLYVLNDLLGGGSSSRLFQEIREKRGLAYSVYSGLSSYRDGGELTLYAACGPDALARVAELVERELARLCEEPAPEDELARIRGHLKGALVLGLESSFGRMSRLAQDELLWHAPRPLEELLEGIDRVDAAQVTRLARRAFDPASVTATVLGAVSELPRGFLSRCPAGP